jgi:hypothetical protein
MAKGMASPTSWGSESPVKTSEEPSPVRALATMFIASLFTEHPQKRPKPEKTSNMKIIRFIIIMSFFNYSIIIRKKKVLQLKIYTFTGILTYYFVRINILRRQR